MIFSQKFINDMKKKINLVDLISEYTDLTKTSSNLYIGKCPVHDDHNPSLRVWIDKNGNHENDNWACMVCHTGKKDVSSKNKNYGSDCIAFYQFVEKVDWKKAVLDLCNKYNIPLPSQENDKLYKEKERLTCSYEENLNNYSLKYLYNRGLNMEDIKKWRIGYDGEKIVFPLMDRYRVPIAFTKRWIDMPENCKDKYKNSFNNNIFNKSTYFYGLHNILQEEEEIRITEGPFDVILADKYKAKNIICTLGTSFTDNHANIIKLLNKTPVFIMDGDSAGIRAAEKAIEKLAKINVYSKILILPNNKDLCDMSLDLKYNIENYIKDNALTYGQYKISNIINSFDSKVNEIKLKEYNNIKNIIDSIPHEAEKKIMKEYIREKMNIKL